MRRRTRVDAVFVKTLSKPDEERYGTPGETVEHLAVVCHGPGRGRIARDEREEPAAVRITGTEGLGERGGGRCGVFACGRDFLPAPSRRAARGATALRRPSTRGAKSAAAEATAVARFRVRRRVAHPAAAFTTASGGPAGFLSAMVTGAVAGSLLACARARIYAGCAKNGGSELAVLGEASAAGIRGRPSCSFPRARRFLQFKTR